MAYFPLPTPQGSYLIRGTDGDAAAEAACADIAARPAATHAHDWRPSQEPPRRPCEAELCERELLRPDAGSSR